MLIYFVIVPIVTGVFLYIFPFAKFARSVSIAAQSVLAVFAAYLFYLCRDGHMTEDIGGFGRLLGITLYADTISAVLVLLTAFIFLLAAAYSFFENDSSLFWFLMFLWEGLLIGMLFSRDLFNIFVLLEVVTLTVSVMIMFRRDTRSMYDGMFYLMVNTVAVQFLLFGCGYLYKITGSLNIDAVAGVLARTDRSSQILPFALIMTAICLKCGLVPLYGWLPRAHGTPGAPPSVSAVLSGLHVKSGIYLFIRFQGIFDSVIVSEFFLATGIATGILGFVFALAQSDIKLILAYHTVSQIGLIMIGLSAGNQYAYTGALYHMFSHALFKSALFFCAGIIVNSYGTRDMAKISGVFRQMPVVAAVIVMASLGITGAPLFNGSISKYLISSGTGAVTYASIILINLGTIVSFIKFSSILPGEPKLINELKSKDINVSFLTVDRPKLAVILTAGILCFLGGVFGERAIALLFNIDVDIDLAGYLEKAAIFAVSAAAGFFIYKYLVKDNRMLRRLQNAEAGFRGICVFMGVFFAALLLTAYFFP